MRESVLFVVLAGAARFRTAAGEIVVRAGCGIWIAAGDVLAIRVGRGDVVLPVPAVGMGATSGARVTVEQRILPELVRAFGGSLGYLDASPSPVEVHGADDLAIPELVWPSSRDLRACAEVLAARPELDVAEWLARSGLGWSQRNVQRNFLAETGMTLAGWLRRSRVVAAAKLIQEGRSLGWVAHHVGYQSVAGFIRAFTREVGATPGRWREAMLSGESRVHEARVVLPRVVRGHAQGTWVRANGAHVAVWAAVGGSRLMVCGRSIDLAEGQAAVIPAGMPNSLEIPPGSMVLPVGFRSGAAGGVGEPLVPAQLGDISDVRVLSMMLAAYTAVGAVGVDAEQGFREVLAGATVAEVTAGDAVLARFASMSARSPHLTNLELSGRLGLDERMLQRAVGERAGVSLAVLRRLLRMTGARHMLGSGAKPSEVSREVGYAHLPAFTRAFRAVHGAPPAELEVQDLRFARSVWGQRAQWNPEWGNGGQKARYVS
ncbi:helix-turn-helix domain-containing protein [Leucobacter sp. cx-42]|uniref:helix-turn-helix domain-containing protein n=1 Tax=unclassified Leucobacter TaxID=2621730 RepID=UPI00165D5676|nr:MULTISPECIES: helix-turn-helix domain-containing protein [unclassified Leucobacter]MBC9953330.1 helix-turn-helix domain-containing protein [Leucobacter sp. cx-42]